MLKLCDNVKQLSFTPADPFCAKITAFAMTYGMEHNFARFYVQNNTAALSIVDGNIVLWADNQADFTEIREFLDVMGYASLQCSEEVMSKLGIRKSGSSYIVRYNSDNKSVKPDNFTDYWDYRDIYSLLLRSGFPMGDYNSFLHDICARLNKGTASFGGIVTNTLDSCCFRLFNGMNSVLLGAVATDPLKRGQGLSSSLVPYMAETEKPSFLFTRNDDLLSFYEKCGFICCGRWATAFKE